MKAFALTCPALLAPLPAAAQDWRAISFVGAAGNRIALFIDKASIGTDANGRSFAMTMLVNEVAGDNVKRLLHRARVDCGAMTRTNLYAELFSESGGYVGTVIPAGDATPMVAGTVYGALARPLCSNDWSGPRSYAEPIQQIMPVAFAP